MRIALISHVRHAIAPPFMGGMEAHNWHLANDLTRRGHDVTLFAAGDSRTDAQLWPVLPRCYQCDYVQGDPGLNPYLDAGFASAVQHIFGGDFDVVHNNSLHRYPPRMARQHRIPCVTSLHIPPFDALHRAVRESAAPWSRFTVTSRRQVESWWGDAPPPEAAVAYNGIDTTLWPFSPRGNGEAVWAGRITWNKGAHLAVSAARLTGIRLTLFGVIEDQAYFDEHIRPYLGHDIRYGGHLAGPDLAVEFGGASVLLFTPLWDEPFGLTAVEAMSCGLPVAAIDMGAAREVIGEAGAFADSPTAEALATALLQAIKIPRTVARSRVLRRFTTEHMIARYEKQYALAIAGLGQSAPTVTFPPIELCDVTDKITA
ncbi:MAG: glycosyltransferase family 4 protein [Paracoccus denitrificans]|nr:MAG: glycosyltransferase family 4 protein [Paracoccus denitrificans]PZO83894.1 MAG: glycosyltransferase family 4 protein [Paracoccus denitrificans]